jgi:hypothetical protein
MTTTDIILTRPVAEYLIQNVKEVDEYLGKSGVRGLKKTLNRIINRVNLYKLASVNGKLAFELSFYIPNFKLPYVLTIDFINQVLHNSGENKKEDYQSMFV